MKKKFKESDIMIAFTQYQVARAVRIFNRLLDNWHGTEFWMTAPDNLLNYLEEVRLHGERAKKVLEQTGFTFKQGTMEVL